MWRTSILILALADVTSLFGSRGTCPKGSDTACPPNSTCCPIQFSPTGVGCCHLPNAVCCTAGALPTGDLVQSCCPEGHTCRHVTASHTECVPEKGEATSALQVCSPGPEFLPDDPKANPKKLPSVIIIGDSVSIGYTPHVIENIKDQVFVQHSPRDISGGGADDTKNGLNCIREFVRTSNFQETEWDLILFNFGLHNLDNTTAAFKEYEAELTNISDYLLEHKSSKTPLGVVYVLTTPMMASYRAGNHAVERNNQIANTIMTPRNIPMLDLYGAVVQHCGKEYVDCDICLKSPCAYHYNKAGYQYIGRQVSDAILGILGIQASTEVVV